MQQLSVLGGLVLMSLNLTTESTALAVGLAVALLTSRVVAAMFDRKARDRRTSMAVGIWRLIADP